MFQFEQNRRTCERAHVRGGDSKQQTMEIMRSEEKKRCEPKGVTEDEKLRGAVRVDAAEETMETNKLK